MSAERIEYVDFTIDNVDIRTTYNIYRTSDGKDGYELKGTPKLENNTSEVPGGNGMYYFGTKYRERAIKIPFAFDHLYREDWIKFVNLFKRDRYHTLVFCEEPYKKYRVRLDSEPTINAIPCDSNDSTPKTIFKGTGSIDLVCDDGFAHSVSTNISDYSGLANYNDWIAESGIIDLTGYNTLSATADENGWKEIVVHNGGNLPTDFILNFLFLMK